MNNRVSLTVNGKDFSGWIEASITMKLTSFARRFTVRASRRTNQPGFPIKIGDTVVLSICDDPVVTGYVTKCVGSYSATSVSFDVEGASKTIDLTECALPSTAAKTFEKMTVRNIVATMISSFGIKFISQVPLNDVEDLSLSPTDIVGTKLVELLKRKSFLLTDDASGRLVLTKSGAAGSSFDHVTTGKNILSASFSQTSAKLFSEYAVFGQGTNPTSERPVTDNQLIGIATDNAIRSRTRAVKQTGNAVQADVDARAYAIRQYSIATAELYEATVSGWRQSNGRLWTLNSFVVIDDSILNVHARLLLTGITFSLSSSGMTTKLEFTNADAFKFSDKQSATEKSVAAKTAKTNDYVRVGEVDKQNWTRPDL